MKLRFLIPALIGTIMIGAGVGATLKVKMRPISNDAIHEWAQDVVISAWPKSKNGIYDDCLIASQMVKTDHKIYDDQEVTDQQATPSDQYADTAHKYGMMPIGLDPKKFSQDLVNACAIILNGAEW